MRLGRGVLLAINYCVFNSWLVSPEACYYFCRKKLDGRKQIKIKDKPKEESRRGRKKRGTKSKTQNGSIEDGKNMKAEKG